MLTVMFAKWVGDIFNHGLYDVHIELEHVPFLEPFPEDEHHVLQVCDVMSRPVCIPERCKMEDLVEILETTDHSTYPVVANNDTALQRGHAAGLPLWHHKDWW